MTEKSKPKSNLDQLLSDLRFLLKDSQSLELLRNLEERIREDQQAFEKQKQVDLDEIRILRNLAGAGSDAVKLHFLNQEKEIAALKRETESLRAKLKPLMEQQTELSKENRRLQEQNDHLRHQSSKSAGQWEVGVQTLEQEKKLLAEEVRRMEERIKILTEQLEHTTTSFLKQSEEEKRLLENQLLNQTRDLLTEQKLQISAEERLILQGLYTYIQNQIGGVAGSSQILIERVKAMMAVEPPLPLMKRLRRLPFQIFQSVKPGKSLKEEISRLDDIFEQNSQNLKKLQKGLQDFVFFTKVQELKPERIHPAELIDQIAGMKENFLKSCRIALKRQWIETSPVCIDRETVLAALSEIIDNAAESQPEGGSVEIFPKEDPAGGVVGIVVKDSGPGIPNHLREKVFQPFFTTKENHSGLGLTRSFRMIALNHGYLELGSGPVGAELTMMFPVDKEMPADTAS